MKPGEGPHALTQVCSWRLARLSRLAGHVEYVVRELEGHADRGAGWRDPGRDAVGRAREHGAELASRRDQRRCLAVDHAHVVIEGVLTRPHPDGLLDLASHHPPQRLPPAPAPLTAQT